MHYPFSVTAGNGYVWVGYANGAVTKRMPGTGSVVSSFYLTKLPYTLAWEENNKYLYSVLPLIGVFWWTSSTGSLAGSFGLPPGARYLSGISYDDGTVSNPIWVSQLSGPGTIWNLSSRGDVVASFNLGHWPVGPECLAYDGDTPGGDFLFVGTYSAPPFIYVVRPDTISIISSFRAPVHDYAIADLTWDGDYLWALDSGRGTPPSKVGWVFRFVAHSSPAVVPASLGKIKALYR